MAFVVLDHSDRNEARLFSHGRNVIEGKPVQSNHSVSQWFLQ
jgi:hypothetical protein